MIHGEARHKPPQSIVSIAPILLLKRGRWKISSGHVELVPTDHRRTSWKIKDPRRIGPQRLCPAKILVNHRRHQSVAKSINLLRSRWLRNNHPPCGIRPCLDKGINGDQCIGRVVRADTESRIRRSHEIDMKLPSLNLGQRGVLAGRAINRQQKFISTRRRRAAGTKTGRDQTVGIAQACGKNGKGNRVGWAAINHRSAVERKDTDSDKCRRIRKHIDREIVTIRPKSELRVVAEVSGV